MVLHLPRAGAKWVRVGVCLCNGGDIGAVCPCRHTVPYALYDLGALSAGDERKRFIKQAAAFKVRRACCVGCGYSTASFYAPPPIRVGVRLCAHAGVAG